MIKCVASKGLRRLIGNGVVKNGLRHFFRLPIKRLVAKRLDKRGLLNQSLRQDSRGEFMISSGAIAINCGCYGFRVERGLSAAVNSADCWVPPNPQHKRAHPRRGETAMLVVRFAAIFLLALSFGVAVARAASVGTVTKVENQAQIGSSGRVVGSEVQTGDQVRTGPNLVSR